MKNFLIIIGLLIVLAVAFYFTRNFVSNNPGGFFGLGSQAEATIGDTTIKLIVAETDEEKQVGLSDRSSLPDDTGMLFQYEAKGYPTFWMKNMRFPIDIVFLSDETVVTVFKNVEPPTSENLTLYQPTEASNNVIELKAGRADALGIEEGGTIEISL